jgi:hypothetical protein
MAVARRRTPLPSVVPPPRRPGPDPVWANIRPCAVCSRQSREGPGGVQASFDFRGAKNTAAGRMLTVTLTNDLDGLVYG